MAAQIKSLQVVLEEPMNAEWVETHLVPAIKMLHGVGKVEMREMEMQDWDTLQMAKLDLKRKLLEVLD